MALERGRREGGVNRVVLLTDGLANVGITTPEQLLGLCARLATRCDVDGGDVTCSCPGFEYRGACSHARELRYRMKSPSRSSRDFRASFKT